MYEIDILQSIGQDFGYPAKYFRYQLQDAADKPVRVSVSSPGGDALEALEMVDEMGNREGDIETLGFGVVASAATLLLVQGSPAKMTPNSFFMIHNSTVDARGRKEDLMNTAGLMTDVDEKMLNIYVKRLEKAGKISGNIRLRVERMMDAETWLTADEALEMGFIDEIQQATKTANIIQMQPALARYINTPAALLLNQNSEDMTAQEVLKKVRAMLGGADEPEVVETPPTEPEAPAQAPALTAEAAMDFLQKSGYKVMTAEEVAAEAAKMTAVEETNVQLAETMQALATEMQIVKAQVKQTIAAPSGASNPTTVKAEDKEKPIFGAFSEFLTKKLIG